MSEFSIVIANEVRTGRSVFLTKGGCWSDHVTDAALAHNGMQQKELMDAVHLSTNSAEVIDMQAIPTDKLGLPMVRRDLIRAQGPTIHYTGSTGL